MSNSLNMVMTTTQTLEGWRIKEYLGPVSAQIVAGTGLFSDIFASFSDIFGGRSASYKKQLRAINDEVTSELAQEAAQVGANCIVGLRIDHDEISGGRKSMFMVTASGTAVKAEKSDGTIDSVKTIRTISADALEVELKRAELLVQAEKESLVWDEAIFRFISQNRLAEFIPHLLRDVKSEFQLASSRSPEDLDSLKEHAVGYLSSMQHDSVLRGMSPILLQEERLPLVIFEIVNILGLLDLTQIITMLELENDRVKRRALRLLRYDKIAYTNDDVPLLSKVIDKIEHTFLRTDTVKEKEKGLLSKAKQVWLCEDNHENDIGTEVCKCGKDIYGFNDHESSPRTLLPKLRSKHRALDAFFSR